MTNYLPLSKVKKKSETQNRVNKFNISVFTDIVVMIVIVPE